MRNRGEQWAWRGFLALWTVVLGVKAVLATRLPLFVDEAFYWQEGQRLAWAYSDLPGLTAWLTRLGVEIGGNNAFALRAPFLLVAAAIPWMVAVVTAREFGRPAGWVAACFALLLPLAGSLGLLALPDGVMVLAALLCVDAVARLFRGVTPTAAVELAIGLGLGALTHYRFIAVIGVGMVVLLTMREGRSMLRDPRVLIALALGASAWAPLIAWNLGNAEAGLRFQLIDRHPWALHLGGAWFVAIQTLLVTPVLIAGLALAVRKFFFDQRPAVRMLSRAGSMMVAGFFLLGFVADTERVSFHWPLPGYVFLLPLLPAILEGWNRHWRVALFATSALGLGLMLAYYAVVSVPSLRARAAAEKWYPGNFAGWETLADAVRRKLAGMPANTWLVTDNFKLGSELGFALDDPSIQVLDHPLNRKHGRAPQLRLWGLESLGRADWGETPVLLVVGSSDVPYRELLGRYHWLCEQVGPLPTPEVINVDHGRQRFLLFELPEKVPADAACTAPAMAWVDQPVSEAQVPRRFRVAGWAFKDGVGLDRVEVTLDGEVVAEAEYGLESPGTAWYWKISTDPNHPRVGFSAEVDASGFAPGRHWLGLRLHGSDGGIEAWSEQPIELR